jgi:hypothetical protein
VHPNFALFALPLALLFVEVIAYMAMTANRKNKCSVNTNIKILRSSTRASALKIENFHSRVKILGWPIK